jgi:hypothetical protein
VKVGAVAFAIQSRLRSCDEGIVDTFIAKRTRSSANDTPSDTSVSSTGNQTRAAALSLIAEAWCVLQWTSCSGPLAKGIADAVSHLVLNPVVNLLVSPPPDSRLRFRPQRPFFPGSDGNGFHHSGPTHFQVEGGSNGL